MDKKKEYLKQCRLYVGENENPFHPSEQPKYGLWQVEKWWYEDTIEVSKGNDPKSPLANCLELMVTDPLIRDKWHKIMSGDYTPVTLFASLYQWWIHKNEQPELESFIQYYNQWKAIDRIKSTESRD